MNSRSSLQTKLEELLGSENVYFQPPAKLIMNYPAIVYTRSNIDNRFANDCVYKQSFIYEITVIDKKADSEIVCKTSKLPGIKFNRHFVSDNLYHDVFTLHY